MRPRGRVDVCGNPRSAATALLYALVVAAPGCSAPPAASEAFQGAPVATLRAEENGGVYAATIRPGTGAPADPGELVAVHVRVIDRRGVVHEEPRHGRPIVFSLGGDPAVIEGLHWACRGMRIGELRRAEIPPALAYRGKAMGDLPTSETLIFEVERVAR